VRLVRTNGRLDAGIERHPGDVAVVIVVAQQRWRALLEKALERLPRREPRRFTEQSVPLREFSLIFERVRHRDELAVRATADGREESACARMLGRGETLHPGFDLFLGSTRRIEVGLWRLGRRALNERLVVVESRPRSLVDREVMQPRTSAR